MKLNLVITFVLLSYLGFSQDKSPRIFIPKSDDTKVKEETKYIHLEHPWSISIIPKENEEVFDVKVTNGKIDTIFEAGQEYVVLRAKAAGEVTVEVTLKKIDKNKDPKYFKESQTVEALADPGNFELFLLEDNFCKKKLFVYMRLMSKQKTQ
tara:strand:+ start:5646 stop:6101 length:456 start_codon:yes stop_codon:yes gene_type:complete